MTDNPKLPCGCPADILGHCHDPKCPHLAHALEKGNPKVTAEEKLLEALLAFCIDRDGDLYDKECALGYIASYRESARAEGYEAARKDLAAIHSAKWAKDDYEKGYQEGLKHSGCKETYANGRAEALEEAAKVVVDYKSSGKFETGHGFITNLDEIASAIRSLSPNSVKPSDEKGGEA